MVWFCLFRLDWSGPFLLAFLVQGLIKIDRLLSLEPHTTHRFGMSPKAKEKNPEKWFFEPFSMVCQRKKNFVMGLPRFSGSR